MSLLHPPSGSARFANMPWGRVRTSTPTDTSDTDIFAPWSTFDVGIPVNREDYIDWFYNVTEWTVSGGAEMEFEGAMLSIYVDEILTLQDDRDARWGLDGVSREIINSIVVGVEHPDHGTASDYPTGQPYGGASYDATIYYEVTVGNPLDATLTQKYMDAWSEDRFIVPITFQAGYNLQRMEDDLSPGGPYPRDIPDDTGLGFDGSTKPLTHNRSCGTASIAFSHASLSGNSYSRSLPIRTDLDGTFDLDGDESSGNEFGEEATITDVGSGFSAWLSLTATDVVAPA